MKTLDKLPTLNQLRLQKIRESRKINEDFKPGDVVIIDPKQFDELITKGRPKDTLEGEFEVLGYDGSNLRVKPVGSEGTAEVFSLNQSRFLNKGKSNESVDSDVAEMYRKFGKQYPHAADLVAYYIFGYKEDNDLVKYIGKHGSELSALAMDYENNWSDNMDTLEDDAKELINESKIGESANMPKSAIAKVASKIKFTSDYDDPNEYDYEIKDNEFHAINAGIANDMSKELTDAGVAHTVKGKIITITDAGGVNEEAVRIKKSGTGYVIDTKSSDESLHLDVSDIKILKKFLGEYIKTKKSFEGDLGKDFYVYITEYGVEIEDKDSGISILLDDIENLKQELLNINESYSINAGKGVVSSKEQAITLIPKQKETKDGLVDFEEGEKITVTDGDNSYNFIWSGGKPTEAPEKQVNEALTAISKVVSGNKVVFTFNSEADATQAEDWMNVTLSRYINHRSEIQTKGNNVSVALNVVIDYFANNVLN